MCNCLPIGSKTDFDFELTAIRSIHPFFSLSITYGVLQMMTDNIRRHQRVAHQIYSMPINNKFKHPLCIPLNNNRPSIWINIYPSSTHPFPANPTPPSRHWSSKQRTFIDDNKLSPTRTILPVTVLNSTCHTRYTIVQPHATATHCDHRHATLLKLNPVTNQSTSPPFVFTVTSPP